MKINYDMKFYGKAEFYPNLNSKRYYVIVLNDDAKESLVKKIFKLYLKLLNKNITKTNKTKHIHNIVAIDYEFNKKITKEQNIALMQICLENNTNNGFIIILYPPILSKILYKLLIKIITSKKVIKLLHGAESLDMPYMFNQLLTKKKYITNFCKNFYDTKFICEYFSLQPNNNITGCSIYNLLLDNKVITQEKFNELNIIDEKKTISYINIHNLDETMTYYALYDVLFLPSLFKQYYLSTKYIKIYKVLSNIINIVSVAKYDSESIYNEIVKFVNNMNIHYIFNKYNMLLNNVWKEYYILSNTPFDYLKDINYFKNFFKIITRFIIYKSIVDKKYVVYINSTTIFDSAYKFNEYFEWFKKYKYFYKLLVKYIKYIENNMKY